jgi:hypothetical protein
MSASAATTVTDRTRARLDHVNSSIRQRPDWGGRYRRNQLSYRSGVDIGASSAGDRTTSERPPCEGCRRCEPWRPLCWLPAETPFRESANRSDSARVAVLGLLGLWMLEASSADIAGLCGEHGHRMLRVRGPGGTIVLVPLPSPAGRAIGPPKRCRWPGKRSAIAGTAVSTVC